MKNKRSMTNNNIAASSAAYTLNRFGEYFRHTLEPAIQQGLDGLHEEHWFVLKALYYAPGDRASLWELAEILDISVPEARQARDTALTALSTRLYVASGIEMKTEQLASMLALMGRDAEREPGAARTEDSKEQAPALPGFMGTATVHVHYLLSLLQGLFDERVVQVGYVGKDPRRRLVAPTAAGPDDALPDGRDFDIEAAQLDEQLAACFRIDRYKRIFLVFTGAEDGGGEVCVRISAGGARFVNTYSMRKDREEEVYWCLLGFAGKDAEIILVGKEHQKVTVAPEEDINLYFLSN